MDKNLARETLKFKSFIENTDNVIVKKAMGSPNNSVAFHNDYPPKMPDVPTCTTTNDSSNVKDLKAEQKDQKPLSTEETELNSIAFLEQIGYTCIPPGKEQKPVSAVEVLVKAGLKPYKDGNQWCILAGDNIQEGICGFGDTIEDALYQFLIEILEMQKPAEWSEDEKMRKLIVADIKSLAHGDESSMWVGYADWLEERLHPLRPKPHWKPSEEQMNGLAHAINLDVYDAKRYHLESLYNDLKKL